MRKARFTEHQIIAVIKSVESGRTFSSFWQPPTAEHQKHGNKNRKNQTRERFIKSSGNSAGGCLYQRLSAWRGKNA